MAFNLKKVLKALLLSSNQPLAIKDIQAAFTRYHEQASQLPMMETAGGDETRVEGEESRVEGEGEGRGGTEVAVAGGEAEVASGGGEETRGEGRGLGEEPSIAGSPAGVTEEAMEISLEPLPKDPELYFDVPSLVTATQIREAMDQISAELKTADEGLLLIEGNSGFRIVTHPRFGRWIRILRQEPPPVKLSQSAIETLAVIAYRQPVTRGEIETIRGVSAEAGINKLLERELVYIVGRADAPGRPIQYGTTDQFLEFIGIKSLDELPASDVLSSRQIDEWLKSSTSAHKPTDTDMGLADEELPLEAPVTPPVPDAPAPEPAAIEETPKPSLAPDAAPP